MCVEQCQAKNVKTEAKRTADYLQGGEQNNRNGRCKESLRDKQDLKTLMSWLISDKILSGVAWCQRQ